MSGCEGLHCPGCGKGAAAIGTAAVIGVLVYEAAKSVARTLGDGIVIGGTAFIALAAGAGMTLLVVRLQGRRRIAPRPQVLLWHANPQAIPAAPRRAIEAPAQPVVNVNIDAGLLGALLEASRQQPVIRAIPAEREYR